MPRGPAVKESGMVRNSIYEQIYFSLVAYAMFFLTLMTMSTYTLGGMKPKLGGGHSTTTKGKQDVTFLLAHSEMTV